MSNRAFWAFYEGESFLGVSKCKNHFMKMGEVLSSDGSTVKCMRHDKVVGYFRNGVFSED